MQINQLIGATELKDPYNNVSKENENNITIYQVSLTLSFNLFILNL